MGAHHGARTHEARESGADGGRVSEKNAPVTTALFESERYTRVQSTLDHISELFDCQVYVEDSGGRLLYTSAGNTPDAWRSGFAPFSTPTHANAQELLGKWQTNMQIYRLQKVVLSEGEERILLPLAYQGNVFAIVHYVARAGTGLLQHFLDQEFAKAVSDKIYIVVIGSINIIRKRYLPIESVAGFLEVLRGLDEHRGRTYQVAYIDFGGVDPQQFSSSVVDYASVAMRHTKDIAKRLVGLYREAGQYGDERFATKQSAGPRFYLLHRREDLLQTVILIVHDSGAAPDPLEARLTGEAGDLLEVQMGLSPLFTNVEEMGDRIEQAQRILEFGRHNGDEKLVFSEHDLGFDAFVWQLFNTQQARAYAGAALRPLERHPELMQTLETYLGNDGNVTKTAEQLVVDRRTITYRLERITNLLGRPMSSMETRVLLFLALKAQKRL